ncbi:hypothetical protein VTJ49DRAFT_7353 [Mycothermus thermophilus]|uniref:Uncharacterized protein n=1 Tax=Humicola insolens TaxID=85995 RepID=A0ABR3VH64_HUMIN
MALRARWQQTSLNHHADNHCHGVPQLDQRTRNNADLLCASGQATSLRNIKALVPLLDRVLVQRVKAEAKTASGIFLPESSVKELNEAKVLAVGPGALGKDGQRVPMSVAAGDRVLIPQVCPRLDVMGAREVMREDQVADEGFVVWWLACEGGR